MAGLVPAIHAARLGTIFKIGLGGTAWMAGTSPAMTCAGLTKLSSRSVPTHSLSPDSLHPAREGVLIVAPRHKAVSPGGARDIAKNAGWLGRETA
jgi:hypothetical protein